MFYLDKNQFSSSMLFNYAIILRLELSRITASFEFSERVTMDYRFKYTYPIADEQFLTYYSQLESSEFNLMPSLSYTFFPSRLLRPFLEFGVNYAVLAVNTEDVSTDKYFASGYYDVNELKQYFQMDKPYTKFLLASGFRTSNFSFGLRYFIKFNNEVEVKNFRSFLCFNLSAYTNFSNLRKHYLYFE
jgi:hypothetical protein